MTGIETALLLSMGGAAISSLWDTPSKASRKFSVDDEIYGPMKQHIDNLEKQKGQAMEMAMKAGRIDAERAQSKIAGQRFNPRDAAAGARNQSTQMRQSEMAGAERGRRTGMQKELILENLIGSRKSGLLGEQLLDRRALDQMAADIPTYGEKFGGAMGQGAMLLGMSGGKGGKDPVAGGGGYNPRYEQYSGAGLRLPQIGSSLPEWGAAPAGGYDGSAQLYGGGGMGGDPSGGGGVGGRHGTPWRRY